MPASERGEFTSDNHISHAVAQRLESLKIAVRSFALSLKALDQDRDSCSTGRSKCLLKSDISERDLT